MLRIRKIFRAAVGGLWAAVVLGLNLGAAELPSDWKNVQPMSVAQTGLVKISLPLDTLTAARPALEDLRLFDSAGREVPFVLAQPVQPQLVVCPPAQFDVVVNGDTTVLTLGTGTAQPVSGVTLVSPATGFLKAVRIEASMDRKTWTVLADGQPIFHQPNGAQKMFLPVPAGAWGFFRLTVDDRRAGPIPFTAAQFHSESGPPAPGEAIAAELLQRTDEPGQTRLALRLAGANFRLAALQFETPEPLFTRPVTLSQQQYVEGEIRETIFFRDSIYRVAVDGQPASENLKAGTDATIRSREIFLTIQNDDNPPLQFTGITASRRPVYLTFLATQSGPYSLLTGNQQCPAPRYDLAALKGSLRDAGLATITAGAFTTNAAYRFADPLAAIAMPGPALDVSAWPFRKRVQLAVESVQQLELDLEVLAHAAASLHDLRVVRDGRQVPYVVERAAVTRGLSPGVAKADDPKRPRVSRWQLTLPQPRTPLVRLTCTASTPYFKRDVRLEEERRDERGNPFTVALGSATWVRELGAKGAMLSLSLSVPPQTGKLVLEIEDGDNPPLDLRKFEAWYTASRLLFKTASPDNTFLYYGNRQADSPRYDLELVVPQLLAANKAKASLSAEEVLKPGALASRASGKAGWLFWGALGLVVIALLLVISRLLPKPPGAAG